MAPAAHATPGDIVEFGSPELENCVQEALGLSTTTPVPHDALAELTSLECETYQIASLEGLEAATGLENLTFRATLATWGVPAGSPGRAEYLDTYFSPIGALPALRRLAFLGGQLPAEVNKSRIFDAPLESLHLSVSGGTSDEALGWLDAGDTLKSLSIRAVYYSGGFAPLSSLSGLEHLRIDRAEPTSALPIAALTRLQTLELPEAHLSEWESLSTLTALRSIDLSDTNVGDIQWLHGANALSRVSVARTALSDVSALHDKPLTWIDLDKTSVSDVTWLEGKSELEYASLRGLGLTSLDFLKEHAALTEVHIDDNDISSLAPLTGSPSLRVLTLNDNEVDELTPLAKLTGLQEVRLDGNRVDDVSPLGDLPQLSTWSALEERGTLPPIEACVQHSMTGGTGIDGSTFRLVAWSVPNDVDTFVVPFNGSLTLATQGNGSPFSVRFEVESYGYDSPCAWPESYLPEVTFPERLTANKIATIWAVWHTRMASLSYKWTLADGTVAWNGESVIAYGIGVAVTPSVSAKASGMETVTFTGPTLTIKAEHLDDASFSFDGPPTVGSFPALNSNRSWTKTSFTCEWLLDGVVVPGTSSCGWVIPSSAAGKQLSAQITAHRENYYDKTYTVAPATVVRPFTKSAAGHLSGTPDVGKSLSVVSDSTGWSPTPASRTYQWLRNGVPISGASGSTYKLQTADAGKSISVEVTGHKAGYRSVTIETNAITVRKIFTTKPTPAISGTPTIGSKLTVKRGTWSPTPSSYAYQWYRNGKAISGATKSTYTTKSTDYGAKITVKVTAKRSGYTTASKTSAPVTIRKKFSKAPTPTITGTAKVKNTLTAKPGTWSPAATFTYQWYRNGKAISGATKSTYKLSVKDAYASITVKVVGKRPGYLTLSKTSAAKVPAGIKYANCAALTKDYPGGVAKSSTTIDKIAGVPGGGILSTTYVSSKLYTLNAARDGDMDGWACE